MHHLDDASSIKETVRLRLNRWPAAVLDLELGVDILCTAVVPTWNKISQLGAIVVLRTALSFFSNRSLGKPAPIARSGTVRAFGGGSRYSAHTLCSPKSSPIDNAAEPAQDGGMTDTETLVIEMAAGLKLVTGMLGLTVALLPEADRALVLEALTAFETENAPHGEADHPGLATRSSAEAARALSQLIEKFADEIRSTGGSTLDH